MVVLPQTIAEREADPSFPVEVMAFPGGDNLKKCVQCGTCTGSCPVAFRMQHTPRKIIEMIRTGLREPVLRSDSIWYCASCYSCSVRCPKGVKVTEVMYILRTLATTCSRDHSTVLYRVFMDSVRTYGRLHEAHVFLRFLTNTDRGSILRMVPLAFRLWRKGRARIWPRRIRGLWEVRKLCRVAEAMGGKASGRTGR